MHLLVEKRNRLKSDLDILLANDAIGYQIRSKAEWVEKGENTAYFLNLEKYYYYYYKGRFIKNQQNYTKTNTVIYKCMER